MFDFNSLPSIDARAKMENLAMTNANYIFVGGEISWSKSASFSSFLGKELQDRMIITVTFEDQIFQGRLARRLCIWGDEEYLECPFPKYFSELVKGKYRRSIDVSIDRNGSLVMTYTPAEQYVHGDVSSGHLDQNGALVMTCTPRLETAAEFLVNATKVEIVDKFIEVDIDYLNTISNCEHEKRSKLQPDPTYSFLERTFEICDSCGVVVSKSGACARDACECEKHDADYSTTNACIDW